MMRLALRRLAAGLLILSAAAIAADDQPVNAGKSRIAAGFTQMNVSVEGEFKRLAGSIAYDPADPAKASARIEIDTASFDIGDEDYNAEVRKTEWFDSKTHPSATFVSKSVKSLGPDRFEAAGTLTLKGRTQDLIVPVAVSGEGAARRYEGRFELSRKAFAIGDKEWDEVLEDKVQLRFRIVAGD